MADKKLMLDSAILDFDSKAARQAADIVAQLKTRRKTIDKPDLFIAATAVVNGLTLDTSALGVCSTKVFTKAGLDNLRSAMYRHQQRFDK